MEGAAQQFPISSPAFSSLQYSGGEKQADRRPAASPAFFLASVGLCAGGGWGAFGFVVRYVYSVFFLSSIASIGLVPPLPRRS